jgi:hypothetical protein
VTFRRHFDARVGSVECAIRAIKVGAWIVLFQSLFCPVARLFRAL